MSAPSTAQAAFTYPMRPLRVYWETTRACDLACRHCRAQAVPQADPAELTFEEGRALLRNVAAFGSPLPHLVFTGGDPFKREDLFDLIAYARELGVGVSVAPSATPLLTAAALRRMRQAGVDAISLSLDGATPADHDAIRGIQRTFARTVNAALDARRLGLPFQINTLVCAETAASLPAVYEQVRSMGAARWSLFFLITVGRGQVLRPLSAVRTEDILRWIADLPGQRGLGGCVITTTEAPQLRRLLREKPAERRRDGPHNATSRRPPRSRDP